MDRDGEVSKILHLESIFLWDVSLENDESEMFQQHSAYGSPESAGREGALVVLPFGHVGEVNVTKVDTSDEVRISVSIEERPAITFGDIYPWFGRDNIPLEVATEVCL